MDQRTYVVLGISFDSLGKPSYHLLTTETIELRNNLLGGTDIIGVAPADVEAYRYIIVCREDHAVRRGWIPETNGHIQKGSAKQ